MRLAANALVAYVFSSGQVHVVRAHTFSGGDHIDVSPGEMFSQIGSLKSWTLRMGWCGLGKASQTTPLGLDVV
jgi:hypothetical protein